MDNDKEWGIRILVDGQSMGKVVAGLLKIIFLRRFMVTCVWSESAR